MLRITRRRIAVGVVGTALALPAAAGADQSFVTPDARDAADATSVKQDYVTPDARVPFEPAPTTQRPAIIRVPAAETGDGFEWGSAGVGAAGMLGIVLAVGAVGAPVVHRRRARSVVATH